MGNVRRTIRLGMLLVATLQIASPAFAMPRTSPAAVLPPQIIKVQTLCDYRGCFGFGPRQWYRPPTYRPPGYQPPTYYRPRAAGTPRLLYQPPMRSTVPVTPPPATRLPTASSRHVEYCLGKYRSYDPATNRYRTSRGLSQVCRSPYR